jgi:hypothetical protein
MFLRMTKRKKDGKEHRYWSIVENHRISGGRVVQKHVLYLGEINDSQRDAWWRSIEILETGKKKPRKISLFPEDRKVQSNDHDVIHVHVNQMRLHRPRQWGACWITLLIGNPREDSIGSLNLKNGINSSYRPPFVLGKLGSLGNKKFHTPKFQ